MSAHQTLLRALQYARLGWHVVPLHNLVGERCSCGRSNCDRSRGKHPRQGRWQKLASCDEQIIRAWLKRWPECNLGIATGARSGIFMVGPDGEEGIKAFARMEKAHEPLPHTPLARSGGGGRHWVFQWPTLGLPGLRNGANLDGLPIDLRTEGGQFVAAPSLHASGKRYRWEVPPSVPVARAPHWLLLWLRNACSPKVAPLTFAPLKNKWQYHEAPDAELRAREIARKWPPAISGCGGHNVTFGLARIVVWGLDLGAERGYDILLTEHNPLCKPPWSERELLHKVTDADIKPCRYPRGWMLRGRVA